MGTDKIRLRNRQKKIGILIGSLEAGGAQRMALWLFESLNRVGVETYLLSVDYNKDIMLPSTESTKPSSLSERIIILSPFSVNLPTILKFFFTPYQWLRLQLYLYRQEFDCLISFMERANILNLCTFGTHNKVLSIRSHPDLYISKDLLKQKSIDFIYSHVLPRASSVVFNANEAKDAFVERYSVGNTICRTIYNYCPAKTVRKLAEEKLPKTHSHLFEAPVLLAVGRLKPEKGFIQLIRAFREVAKSNNAVRLVILGEGPLRRPLENQIVSLNLSERVFLPGFFDNPMPWINSAHIFVLPSIWEGFPNALLEALTLGTAIISTDCRSGPREILSPGSRPSEKTKQVEITPFGILCPPLSFSSSNFATAVTEQEIQIAESVKRLLNDEHLRQDLIGNSAQRAKEFSPENILPEWLDLIQTSPSCFSIHSG